MRTTSPRRAVTPERTDDQDTEDLDETDDTDDLAKKQDHDTEDLEPVRKRFDSSAWIKGW
jgi:hypothetical protein